MQNGPAAGQVMVRGLGYDERIGCCTANAREGDNPLRRPALGAGFVRRAVG